GLGGRDCGADAGRVLGDDEPHVEAQQLLRETGESVELSISEPHFDGDVSSLAPPVLTESFTKCSPRSQARFARLRREHSDLHWWLLGLEGELRQENEQCEEHDRTQKLERHLFTAGCAPSVVSVAERRRSAANRACSLLGLGATLTAARRLKRLVRQ